MNYDPKNTKSLMYTLDFTNQMLCFDLEKKEWNPEPMKVDGNAPAGRHFHSTVVYEKNLYIFGGKSNGYKNDLYKYDTGKIILFKSRGKHLDFNQNNWRYSITKICPFRSYLWKTHVCFWWV
jgi:hypothetical protein